MQIIKGNGAKVIKNKQNERFIKVFTQTNTFVIPAEIAALGAGKDAWMKEIAVTCRDCKAKFKLNESDSHLYCEDCFNKEIN